MPKAFFSRFVVIAAAALGLAGCTVHQDETPDLAGPSEFALSFGLTATPDSISQDGGSQSAIVVSAFDVDGRPRAGITFRLDMFVEDQAVDYGTLSGKTIVTGTDGKARAMYTAPPPLPPGSNLPACYALPGGCIEIVATPIGTNYVTTLTQSVQIHLVPMGVIQPPALTPTASFTITPTSPAAASPAQFDASASCAGPADVGGSCPASAGTIVSYAWAFSDGGTASGRVASHTFSLAQTYSVTLTVTNDRGRSASSTKQVSVGSGASPTALFVYSPTPAVAGADIFFDASASRPGIGHTIASYSWNWGDGESAGASSSPVQDHDYHIAGAYIVVLTVTDEAGQTGTASQSIAVAATGSPGGSGLTAVFVSSPSAPTVGQQVNFDASGSTASAGRKISQYAWNFGDGTSLVSSASPQATHSFIAAGTYSVTLSITDDLGQTATKSQSVIVGSSPASAPPTAAFVSSPSAPSVSQQVNFDASASQASAGLTITQYQWNFGDGAAVVTSASRLANHTYTAAGTYTVVLRVTDSAGQTGLTSNTVNVGAQPTANWVFSPTNPTVGQQVNVDASQSVTAPGRTITNYQWNFGDGSPVVNSAAALNNHTYATANTFTVVLTVTDSAGQTGVSTKTIAVSAP